MAIRLLKGLQVDGRTFGAMDLVFGLSAQQEATLIRGGDAAIVTALDLPPIWGLTQAQVDALLQGGGGTVTVINTLSSTDPTAALSAAQGTALKQLVDQRALAITASPVVPAGTTTLTRAATAGAQTGHYNRPLFIDGDKTIDSTGAVDTDQVYAFNISAVPRTVTAGSVVATIPAKSWGELTRAGGAWYDTSAAAGTPGSYTDAQARAAAVLPGALGTSTTQAPTHAAVADAIANAGGSTSLPSVALNPAGMTLNRADHAGTMNSPRLLICDAPASYLGDKVGYLVPQNPAAGWIANDTLTLLQRGLGYAQLNFVQATDSTNGYLQTSGAGTTVTIMFDGSMWVPLLSALHTKSPSNGSSGIVLIHEGKGPAVFASSDTSTMIYMMNHQLWGQGTNSGINGINGQAACGYTSTAYNTQPADGSFAYSHNETYNATEPHSQDTSAWTGVRLSLVSWSPWKSQPPIAGLPSAAGVGGLAFNIEGKSRVYYGTMNRLAYLPAHVDPAAARPAWAYWTEPTAAGRSYVTLTAQGQAGEQRDTGTASFTIANMTGKVIVAGSGTKTITFPAVPFDGQILMLTVETAQTALTLAGNGKTIIAGTIGNVAGSFASWSYTEAVSTWHRIG